MSGDGAHALGYYSVDKASNTESTHTLALPIDATRPLLTVLEISADGGRVPGEYLNAAPKPKYCIAPNSPKQEAVPCDADDKKSLPDKEPVTKQ